MKIDQISQSNSHDALLWSVDWNSHNNIIVTAGQDRQSQIFQFCENNNEISQIEKLDKQHSKSVCHVSINQDGSLIACASFDSTISIWALIDDLYQCVSVLDGHEYEVKCVDWHASNNLLCTCARDKSIWVWEYTNDFEFYCVSIINAHSQDVKKARWISQRDFIVSSGYDNFIKIWQQDEDDEEEYFCLQEIKQHQSIVWDTQSDAEGNFLFSCSEDLSVCLFKWNSQKFDFLQKIQNLHDRPIYTLSFDNVLKVLFVASGDNKLTCLKLENEKLEKSTQIQADQSDINCIKVNEKLQMIAVVGDSKKLTIFKYNF